MRRFQSYSDYMREYQRSRHSSSLPPLRVRTKILAVFELIYRQAKIEVEPVCLGNRNACCNWGRSLLIKKKLGFILLFRRKCPGN